MGEFIIYYRGKIVGEGKKKMRQLGSVSLPSEAFTAVLKLDSDDD